MSNMVVCSGGQNKILQSTVDNFFNIENVLHLYKNNHTPLRTDTVSAFTECNFTGYASQNMRSWGSAYDNGSSQAETDHAGIVFTATGSATSNTIYGYYVTDHLGNLLFAQIDDNPFFINANGMTYTVVGKFLRQDI